MASRKLQSRSPLAAGPGADWDPNLHLHDLRHTGNTLAAQSGPSLRDLMTRMGHDSTSRCPDLSAQQPGGRRGDRGSPRRPAHRRKSRVTPNVVGPVEGPTEPQLITVEPGRPGKGPLTRDNSLERMTGIEPALSAWEADVLPLNYIRLTRRFTRRCVPSYPTRDLRMTGELSEQPA